MLSNICWYNKICWLPIQQLVTAVRIEQYRAIFRISLPDRRKKYAGISNAREESGQARAIVQSSLSSSRLSRGLDAPAFSQD